jgi:hypothetical protein
MGVALITHPHLAPRLRKEYSYTSTPPLGLHSLFQSELYLFYLLYLLGYASRLAHFIRDISSFLYFFHPQFLSLA